MVVMCPLQENIHGYVQGHIAGNQRLLANGLLGKNGPRQMPVVGDCGDFLILSEP